MWARVMMPLALVLALGRVASAQEPAAGNESPYVWAGACKQCHEPIYDAWAKSKHSTTLGRLSSSEKETECVTCHVSGAKQEQKVDGKTVNAGVQCESCHGAGRAHVESAKTDPATHVKLAKVPASEVCEACHNKRSPRFKGFFYKGMAAFVHRVNGK